MNLIFSSGGPKNTNKDYGGGIYQLIFNNNNWHYKKKISAGNCYGITKYKENFVCASSELGVFEFNKNFRIIRKKNFSVGSRPHGISYSEDNKEFYVTMSNQDKIIVLDNNFDFKFKIEISEKFKKFNYEKTPHHHCNDCVYHNGYLYVSMFSETGNWKNDVYDGCILEIDIENKKILKPIKKNLWMPHNPEIIEGSFYVNDSLKGDLLGNNFSVLGSFPAFTRGLAHDGTFFYLGQSRNRNPSKNIGVKNNISIDAGIIVFDEKTKLSKFLQISSKISEIHSIKIFKDDYEK